nr:hypothetical protein Iba_chr13eCG11520 [Ipomoea batatas]
MQRRSPMVGYDKHLQWRTQGVEVPRRRAATELTGDTTVATTSSMVRLANNSFDQGLLLGDEMEEVARMKEKMAASISLPSRITDEHLGTNAGTCGDMLLSWDGEKYNKFGKKIHVLRKSLSALKH